MLRAEDWEKLRSPDIKLAWSVSAAALSSQISEAQGEKFKAVPRVEEAPMFDLMVCFARPAETNGALKLFTKEYDFISLGHLSSIANEMVDSSKLLEICKDSIQVGLDTTKLDAVFYDAENGKKIEIKLEGMRRQVMNWAGVSKGQLIVDLDKVDLKGSKTIHMITDVIYADKVCVKVTVDNETRQDCINQRVPVAFRYSTFPVNTIMIIGDNHQDDAKDTHLDVTFSPSKF